MAEKALSNRCDSSSLNPAQTTEPVERKQYLKPTKSSICRDNSRSNAQPNPELQIPKHSMKLLTGLDSNKASQRPGTGRKVSRLSATSTSDFSTPIGASSCRAGHNRSPNQSLNPAEPNSDASEAPKLKTSESSRDLILNLQPSINLDLKSGAPLKSQSTRSDIPRYQQVS